MTAQAIRAITREGECWVRQQTDGLWAVYGILPHAEADQYPIVGDYDERALALAFADGYTTGAYENR